MRHRGSPSACLCMSRVEIMAGSVDGTVRRFDVRAGMLSTDQLGSPVTSVALSGDGNCVLASCLDGALRLLDKAGGELLAQYAGDRSHLSLLVVTCLISPSSATGAFGRLDLTGRVSHHGHDVFKAGCVPAMGV